MPLDSPRYHVGHVVRTGEPVVVRDWEAETRYDRPTRLMSGGVRSTVTVAIGRPPRPWGMLSAHSRRPGQVGADAVVFMQAAANLLASALDRLRDEEEIAALAAARGRLVAQALDAEDRTRREISEALRGGPLQELEALAEDIAALAAGDDREALHRERACAGVARAVRQLRESMVELHPVELHAGGLEAAVAAVADQQAGIGGFAVAVDVAPGAAGRRDELVVALARELLVNAARHARATRVRVSISATPGALTLEVADDGAGIPDGRLDEAVREGHIGLASAAERLEAIGGRLELQGGPGAGTTAVAVLPLP
jgi:two-component system NarL family sensor kinase